ncbi:MAG: response regulator transcription factor [Chromatiaceae bacterium]
MYRDPLELRVNRLSMRRPTTLATHSTQDSTAEAVATTIRVGLAAGPGMFRQGVAALLAAEPDVELLDQVADGEAAWKAIQALEPDVAILDQVLPTASGIEVARRVAAAALGTRCLLLAMHEDATQASQALRAGAAGYVLKENSFEELMLALRSIDAGGTFVSPSIATRLRALRHSGQGAQALSPRELEVVRLLAAGMRSKEIARALAISPQTVETHRRRLMRKLEVHSTAEVVRYAAQSGVLV